MKMVFVQTQRVLEQKLLDLELLTPDQLAEAVGKVTQKGVPFNRFVVDSGWVSKERFYEILAGICGVPYVDVSNFEIPGKVIASLPGDLANRYKAVPLFKVGNTLNIAMENPSDVSAIDRFAQKCQCDIDVCLGAPDDIEAALAQYYGAQDAVTRILRSLEEEKTHALPWKDARSRAFPPQRTGLSATGEDRYPVIQLVDLILRRAYEERASDIHIEPEEKMLRIRYRVDGVLQETAAPPKSLESEIISRIKVLAQMNIAENRLPQDGKIQMAVQGKSVNMRVSSMPTLYGENLVIRILKDSSAVMDLASLGLNAGMQKIFENLIQKPHGIILETGPTGSGKTTTLYAALHKINSVERNIVTIEDPVEYRLPLIRQIQVNNKAGLTFANALRSILRQDPDVIMVGEIRDRETAEIAIQASLTGHLVFSTLHTGSAAGVITRLVDMKVEPFLVASSVIGIISQRLVRLICQKCKEEEKPSELLLQGLRVPDPASFRAFKGKGCRHCHQSGYKGRVGVFEVLKMTENIQKKIIAKAGTSEIEKEARGTGFKGLREDVLEKVQVGLTTLEEAVKVADAG